MKRDLTVDSYHDTALHRQIHIECTKEFGIMRGKLLFFLITIMILAFAGYLFRVAFVGDPLEGMTQVRNLRLTQEGTEVAANWDEVDGKGYMVNCFINGRLTESHVVKDNMYTMKNVQPGDVCEVIVRAKLWFGLPSLASKATLRADKVKQIIAIEKTAYYGFAGNDFKLDASANGDLQYSSSDERIAAVDGNGRVTLGNDGEAEISITAEGNGYFTDAERTVTVFVYPAVLDKITGTAVENLSPTKALIRWNQDEYATGYKVMRKNPATGEFKELKETTYDVNYLEVVRNDYDYAVKGIAEVDGQRIDGKNSDVIKVRGTTEESPSYSKLKIIKKLTKADFEVVAFPQGGPKARIPQGISVTKDQYLVTYVNRKSTIAYLLSYKKKNGKLQKTTRIDEVGHGNGCAYNPYTKKLYVLAGKKGNYSGKCFVYDPKTHKRLGKIKLPVAATGISFDKSTNKFYLALGDEMYVCDSKFRMEKTLKKSIRYINPQDIGAYNSAFMICTWIKKNKSFIDIYRVSDGAYLGTYDVSLGEIESCTIDDGYLVILMNTIGSIDDKIYKTKKRIAIP